MCVCVCVCVCAMYLQIFTTCTVLTFCITGFRKSPTKSYKPGKVTLDIFEDDDDDDDISDLDDLDLSDDLDLDVASDADSDLTLSGKLDEFVSVGKTDALKAKRPAHNVGWKASKKEDPFSASDFHLPSSSGHVNGSSEETGQCEGQHNM